ncbi:MAG: hypothetical protein DCC65_13160 [Planctomycetota bacterium]|nr:MAG: hypothetical protein DCC65_13160 [Planctomycetota bacterium]
MGMHASALAVMESCGGVGILLFIVWVIWAVVSALKHGWAPTERGKTKDWDPLARNRLHPTVSPAHQAPTPSGPPVQPEWDEHESASSEGDSAGSNAEATDDGDTDATKAHDDTVFVKVAFRHSLSLAIPFDHAKAALKEALTEFHGFAFVREYKRVQKYCRGDKSITCLPTDREVRWREIPVTLTVRFESDAEEATAVEMSFDAPKDLEFKRTCADFFHAKAEAEFDEFVELLGSFEQKYEEFTAGQGDDDERAETAGAGVDTDASGKPWSADDLRTLGLSPGCTWSTIQTAYRSLCLLYHPDRVNSPSIPPHLVELAAEKFKQISAAYQRLREHQGD